MHVHVAQFRIILLGTMTKENATIIPLTSIHIRLDLLISEKKIMLYWGHAILAYAVRGDSYS